MTLKKSGNLIHNIRGQVTIFFAVIIIAILGLFAMVINVGLFVKTKINFQNAVDGAAFAGAAVQARQLTNIAYLNWELHNTYKEWMFKYYVLGQASLTNTLDSNFTKNTPNMSFRARPLNESTSSNIEPYNLPSVCIQPINNTSNVCEIYDVPGLPRFSPMGIAGIDDEQRAFVNSVSAQKAMDCTKLSQLNFSTLLQWIYGVDDSEALPGAPQIAAGRMGAWPQALELGMRMRNLEMVVNRPPVDQGICITTTDGCGKTLENLQSQDNKEFPVNERPIKAFLSAYKALGSEFYQGGVSELKQNLVLYELAPQAQDKSSGDTLDNFLIPVSSGNSEIMNPRVKYYLNLKILPINYVNFFTFFVPTVGSYNGIRTDVQCKGSKTALPVPGYIFGFVKDPEVLTYYAVKAKTKYIGLLYPFSDRSGITMKAYAAAKPFGGRIGPHVFDASGTSAVTAREISTSHFKSAPFISGLDVSSVGVNFKAGYPLPLDTSFWVADASTPIGGNPKAGAMPTFGIPNMLYDIMGNMSKQYGATGQKIGILKEETTYAGAYQNVSPAIGLYDPLQFQQLSKPYQSVAANPQVALVNHAIDQARRPTRYDALNYLIPSFPTGGVVYDAPASVINNSQTGGGRDNSPTPRDSFGDTFNYTLYAPIFGPGSLYGNQAAAEKVIQDYIDNNQTSVDIFLKAFFNAATDIRNAAGSEDPEIYEDGANAVHNGSDSSNPDCRSIAGRFNAFFTGNTSPLDCNTITPLKQKIIDNWTTKRSGGLFDRYYRGIYAKPTSAVDRIGEISSDTLMTAYAPGKTHYGNGTDVVYPYTGTTYRARRNYYSTKFISLSRVLNTPVPGMGGKYISSGLPAIWDWEAPLLQAQSTGYKFVNPIKAGQVKDWFKFNNIDH